MRFWIPTPGPPMATGAQTRASRAPRGLAPPAAGSTAPSGSRSAPPRTPRQERAATSTSMRLRLLHGATHLRALGGDFGQRRPVPARLGGGGTPGVPHVLQAKPRQQVVFQRDQQRGELCVRPFRGPGEWQYLEGATWTKFIPFPTDVLVARIEFDNNTITSLKGEDEEFFTVKKGFVDGDLEFTLGSSVVTVVGTSFVARCGEDLWCGSGVRPSGTDGSRYCCASSCGTCGGTSCSSNGALDICCLETLLAAGRVCRDHSDVSCLLPEASPFCGGNLQLNNFESADAMSKAGWTIDTASDSNLFTADASYIGYRGWAASAGGISLALKGYGTLDLVFGNGNSASGTDNVVEVLLDSVSVATASNSESEKTVSIDFTDGNTLQINDKGDAIILVKGLAFKCLMQEFWPRVAIKSGEFGAPSEYVSWPAETCYHEYEQPEWWMSAQGWTGTVTLSSATVATTKEGLFPVTYSCTKDGVESTRSVVVEVRHPIKLAGLSAMIVRQSSGTFSEPGVSCVDRDLVIRSVTSSPASLSLSETGDFFITYSCQDGQSRTSTLVRYVQVAPPIELRGDEVLVLEKDSTWNDPGVQCVDTDNGLLQHSASTTVDMSTAGTTTITYSCTDSSGTALTATRTVIVSSGLPGVDLQGPAEMKILLGETFTDPGVCCRDGHNQVLPFKGILNEAHSSSTGTQSIFYRCTSFAHSETASRIVTVNNEPKIYLTGDAQALSILGSSYTDPGAICTDVEDGLITVWGASGLGSVRQLRVVRVGASGTVTSGVVENIIDGDEASSVSQACESCVEVSSSSYLWLDLGAGKVVHKFALAATVTSATLKVGPTLDVGFSCKTSLTQSLGSATTVECDAPLVGRYVTLSSSSSMKVCELSIWGTVGPAAPARINVSATPDGCTGVDSQNLELAGQDSSGLGVMYSTQAAGSYGEMRTDLGTGPHLKSEAVSGKVPGTEGAEKWHLRDSSGNEVATAPGGFSFLPLEVSHWSVTASGATCTGLVFGLDPEEACAWLFGTASSDGKYLCGDGSECSTEGCCLSLGGLARGPPDAPRMCAAQSCTGETTAARRIVPPSAAIGFASRAA
ncbi:unnamed protein product [Effrenium voratum]|nr:unnamed protein product [Effrenium voratum]